MSFENELIVKDISTDLYGTEFVSLSWDAKPINLDGTYYFNVYRSVSNQIEDAHLIAYQLTESSYVDYDINRRNKTFDLWYWVGVNKVGSSGEDLCGPKHLEASVKNIATAVRSSQKRLLENIIKNSCYFFIKRRTGGVCVCSEGGTVPNIDCEICYGTGYIGGYSDAISAYISISPSEVYHDNTASTIEKSEARNGWTTFGPTLNANDMVYIKASDILYTIKNVVKTSIGGAIVRQVFMLYEVPGDSILYKLIDSVV